MEFALFFLTLAAFYLGTTYADLASDVKLLKARVEELEKFKATQTTYCNLHVSGKCGPCMCKDDFNLPEKFYCDCQNQPPKRDCLDYYQNGYRVDGIYKITLNGFKTIQVFCDQTTHTNSRTGGWTVIQRRMDGSTNFYRRWYDYKSGFGELQREFWLGNENIHLLTLQGIYPRGSEAMVSYRSHNYYYHSSGSYYYNRFQVDGEKQNYMLHITSGGYLGDSNNVPFSTYDKDNDGSSSYHCARNYNYGGWWYDGKGNTCTGNTARANFNGVYDADRKMSWEKTLNYGVNKVTYVTMKVRRL